MDREQIFVALYNLIADNIDSHLDFTIKKKSRVLKHWDDVMPVEQPCIFLTKGHEKIRQTTGLNSEIVMSANVWVYAQHKDKTVSPATISNKILDALQKCLVTDSPTNTLTLGGLVHHCWIEGDVVTDEGFLGTQAVIQVPINILTTND